MELCKAQELDHQDPQGVNMKISNKKPPPNRGTLNLENKSEARHWTKEWGVTRCDLQAAIDKVGPAVHAVAKELGKSA
jgi:Protein of unknown function (DUF3606)